MTVGLSRSIEQVPEQQVVIVVRLLGDVRHLGQVLGGPEWEDASRLNLSPHKLRVAV